MSNDEKLVVKSVHLYPLENGKLHHTDKFEMLHQETPRAILRRAQPFHLVVNFSGRGYDPEKDSVQLIFSYGLRPNVIKGTKGVSTVTEKKTEDENAWYARLVGKDESSMNVEVRSPPDTPVGLWKFQIETRPKDDPSAKPKSFTYDDKIYILFNPWAKSDQVYMSDERLLDEYVLSDVGKIWVGPYNSSRGREWVYGQFDDAVLPAIDLMLSRTNVAPVNRGNPIYVTRAISKIVNSNDSDMGVLTGRWDGKYEDGTPPAAWTGSVPILEEYLETQNEVKYGQCWVFAGVVTTVCRALGIPCRPVSNLVSAHDANASLTIDRYYDTEMELLDFDPTNPEGEDSIWNYHVWNDVWMARPDLPKGYGGWQAIDATPQETSDGVYQCGPASVEAVKCGVIGFNYDVSFLLSTVNADLVRWKEDTTDPNNYAKIDSNKYHIGRMILTKKPWIYDPNGDRDREDITEIYKNKEGTKAERLTLLNGVRASERAKRFYMLPTKSREEIDFELVNLDVVNLGETFSVTVNIHNRSDKEKTVQAVLSAASIFYTGIKAHVVKKATGDFKVAPKAKEMLRLTVKPEEYVDKLVEYCNMKIYAIATVVETNETWGEEDDFQVLKPNLDIKVIGNPVVNKPISVKFSFKNPLKTTLTNCKFHYAGPGLVRNTAISYRDVLPEEEVKLESSLTPQRSGKQKLVATFSSKELVDITGSANIEVFDEEE
ncbi:hemocyte protein-glutamine gamma-glutamyltransferase-like [Periplaneta americana]|uniref:hemocyte protein-glutamine gamma-glutamyltransferase-like n=1 Tax=Periplaneta americana TaxID=6978 RepID=UPI0037E701D7